MLRRFPAGLLPIAALAVYFGGLFSVAAVSGRRVDVIWRHLGVSALPVPFLDLQIVAGVIESLEHPAADGKSPPATPAYTWRGFYLYPGFWLQWRHLGLDLSTVRIWAPIIVLLFWAMAIHASRPPDTDMSQGLYLAALLCAPPCMLAVERCNNDLVVFALVATALLVRSRPWLATGVMALAAIGKIYPIFAGPALGSGARWRRWAPTVAIAVGLAGYAAVNLDDFRQVWQATPRRAVLSYGAAVPLRIVATRLGQPVNQTLNQVGGWIAAGCLIAATLRVWKRAPATIASPHDAAFLAGAGIYGGTFLIGSNHDYRCVFLLLCLPALWEWRRHAAPLARASARAALWALQIFFWWNLFPGETTLATALARQAMAWALFALLGGLMWQLLRRDAAASWSRP